MRLVADQVSNIRLRPSPRGDIGATRKLNANIVVLDVGTIMTIVIDRPEADRRTRPLDAPVSSHRSSALEKVLEYRFLAALTTELVVRGSEFEVLRGDTDLAGHDLVIEANGILRHIQLKAMIAGGKRANVGISTRLSAKPSGCVIWMIYDPATLELGPWRWFGEPPGMPLPPLGGRVVRHSKANALGEKAMRTGHRLVPIGRFERIAGVAELTDRLFGPNPGEECGGELA